MGDKSKRVTLEGVGCATIIEKKSEFIGYARPVSSEQEAIDYIKAIRKKHADARHNVYAYMLGNTTRYSDDGEPQGTAGMPVLDVIRKNGIDGVVIVVTRYFGGILLGTGGLVRAYTAAASAAVGEAHIVTYEQYDELSLCCSYSDYPKIEKALPTFDVIVDGVDFADSVTVRFACLREKTDALTAHLRDLSAGRVAPEIIGERFDKK